MFNVGDRSQGHGSGGALLVGFRRYAVQVSFLDVLAEARSGLDRDNDGTPDFRDPDDDGDTILTRDESFHVPLNAHFLRRVFEDVEGERLDLANPKKARLQLQHHRFEPLDLVLELAPLGVRRRCVRVSTPLWFAVARR